MCENYDYNYECKVNDTVLTYFVNNYINSEFTDFVLLNTKKCPAHLLVIKLLLQYKDYGDKKIYIFTKNNWEKYKIKRELARMGHKPIFIKKYSDKKVPAFEHGTFYAMDMNYPIYTPFLTEEMADIFKERAETIYYDYYKEPASLYGWRL